MTDKPADQRAPEPRYQGVRQAINHLIWTVETEIQGGRRSSAFIKQHRAKIRYWIEQVRERLAAAEPREGETQDDWSPGDIIDAKPDGTIVLDDGITTHNARRAKDYLAGKRVADRPAASQGSRDSLVRQCAEWLHLNMAAAENLPYEDGDVCEECLEAVGEWISAAQALAASQPPQELEGALELARGLASMMIIGYENEQQGKYPPNGHIHRCQSCYEKALELRAALTRGEVGDDRKGRRRARVGARMGN